MTKHQKAILLQINTGQSYKQICAALGISRQNIYTTCWRLRKKGISTKPPKPKVYLLTPTQHIVLYYYSTETPIMEISKKMKIKPQTIMNHANQGFIRLGLTVPGVNRIEALKSLLNHDDVKEAVAEIEAARKAPVTMDDPFFN